MRKTEQNKLNKTRVQQTGENGITLVSLVITIIVLLVLAGVAINMAINSEGLFAKANEATEEWNTAVGEEQNQVQDLLEQMPIELPAGWDATKVGNIITETSEVAGVTKERIAPVPIGYTVSKITTGENPENTISGGLVIYDIPDGAQVDWSENTITIDGETKNLQENVNQFVWIPVDDINQMVMCKSNTESSQCDLKLVDGVLQCTNPKHSTNKTNLCGRLYGGSATTTDTSTPKTYITNMNFAARSQSRL